MTEPRWMTREEVEVIQTVVIEIGGGSHGLRDAGLLESALGRVQNQYAYGEQDVFQLAAGYAEGIARNHPFVDGNKRTAFQTADVFLAVNGHELQKAEGIEYAEMMEQLGQGNISREDMGKYLADHAQQIEQAQPARDDLLQDYADQHAQEDDGRDLSRDHDMADDD
ncbi:MULTISPECIES: type II toxin-antitoxin system death-on-curing family toxin [unclassified Phaeobacter]|uniref:type II toxin-antitoxin system death-on-curing family toxin n=1 Tax=unclassified Phaeobacter TaxID=2621772 RepID=UPI003A85B9D3